MNKLAIRILLLAASALVTMAPSYNATTPAPQLMPGGSYLLLTAEQPASSTYSQQVYVPFTPDNYPPIVSLEFSWPSNPGTFNYQIQDADTDTTDAYQTLPIAGTVTQANATAGPSGTYYSRVELSPFKGKYLRIYVSAATSNAVNTQVKVTR